jgi:hypothetical protein
MAKERARRGFEATLCHSFDRASRLCWMFDASIGSERDNAVLVQSKVSVFVVLIQ